jgi:hypothetical protein
VIFFKLFDSLDFQRAVQAYLFAMPAVSQANRNAFQSFAPLPESRYPYSPVKAKRRFPKPKADWEKTHAQVIDFERDRNRDDDGSSNG